MDDTTPRRVGLASLLGGILEDFKTLMRQEAQPLRHEFQLELSKTGRAASGFGIGIALAAVAAPFLLLMLVHGLTVLAGLSLWASYGLVGGLLAGLSAACLVRAQSMAGRVHLMPRRSLFAIKEHVQWITERMTYKRT
ncbi:MAG: conserved protein of unknown function [Nitrospira sp.]